MTEKEGERRLDIICGILLNRDVRFIFNACYMTLQSTLVILNPRVYCVLLRFSLSLFLYKIKQRILYFKTKHRNSLQRNNPRVSTVNNADIDELENGKCTIITCKISSRSVFIWITLIMKK